MERDRISDDVRYVVNKRHIGSIFPTKKIELNRDVFLHDGAEINGAIYGHSLYVTGGTVTVFRSVFANHSLKIAMEEDGRIDFKSSVNAGKSLFTESYGKDNYIRVRGDIFVENANLNGMIVYGNIYGHHVNISGSAVLGGVFATGKVITRDCLVGAVMGKRVHLNDATRLWLPHCIGEERLEISGRVKSFTLGLPDIFRDLLDQKLMDISEYEVVLNQEDVYTVPAQKSGDQPDAGDGSTLRILTLQPRIYDITSARATLKANLRTHSMMLNLPGIPEREKDGEYNRFDDALRNYFKI